MHQSYCNKLGSAVSGSGSDIQTGCQHPHLTLVSASIKAVGVDVGVDAAFKKFCSMHKLDDTSTITKSRCTFLLRELLSDAVKEKAALLVEGEYQCNQSMYTYKFGNPEFSIDCRNAGNLMRNIPTGFDLFLGWAMSNLMTSATLSQEQIIRQGVIAVDAPYTEGNRSRELPCATDPQSGWAGTDSKGVAALATSANEYMGASSISAQDMYAAGDTGIREPKFVGHVATNADYGLVAATTFALPIISDAEHLKAPGAITWSKPRDALSVLHLGGFRKKQQEHDAVQVCCQSYANSTLSG